jgi:hypothetical protein
MSTHHLAQVNIAKMLAPIDDPIMQDFVNNLDRINAIADDIEGFIWRLKGDEDNATAIRVFEDDSLIINMSVWKDIDSLFNFTYKSGHIEVFKRRKEWFSKIKMQYIVFWYVPINHIPTPEAARERLEYINTHGETPYAFTFRNKFSIRDSIDYIK